MSARPTARLVAQAKVNLALRILAQERSGFHQLETLFARLELGDEVVVRAGGAARSLDCRGADVGPVERNLAWRAAEHYAAATGWPGGFAIEIEKRIPVGGGLGGGSADAGAVLRALNALAPRPLAPAALLELAAPLGADVPFLTGEAPLALAWGRGERLLALPPLPARDVALVLPPFGVPTADAYAWLAAARAAARAAAGQDAAPRPILLAADALASWAGVTALASNDFEPVVAARHPTIERLVGQLAAHGARIARMSGSGSSVFGIFDAPPDRAALAALGCPVVHTRTAVRVVGVEVLD